MRVGRVGQRDGRWVVVEGRSQAEAWNRFTAGLAHASHRAPEEIGTSPDSVE